MNLALFEDEAAVNLLPLTWTRPVWDLRCGMWTLREAIEAAYGHRADALFVRDFLAGVVRERTGKLVNGEVGAGMWLLLNGRLLADRELPRAMSMYGEPCRFVDPDGTLLGAWASAETVREGKAALAQLPARIMTWPLIQWPWELIHHNTPRLEEQAKAWDLGNAIGRSWPGVHLVEPERIFIHPNTRIQPGVVLDATDGPIVIEGSTFVMANSVIMGPGYVGAGSLVKIGAKIYHGTTIGPVCKIGGEVEESIFHGYSNKQHDGFMGHSYIGEWCNFGADSNNSDLKNTYGPVSVWVNGAFRNTDMLFVGLFMGDHSKAGINSMFNTGTVVGVSCNLFGGGFLPRHIPSFAWGSPDGMTDYRLERAIETAERVMARRHLTLSQAERDLLAYIWGADQ